MSDFKSIDKNGDDKISIEELRDSLRASKLPCSNADVLNLFHRVDTNNDGVISKQEYAAFTQRREAELLKMFHTLDRDSNGMLNSTEVKLGIRALGLNVSSSQLRQVMESLSTENQGRQITFDTWRNALLLLPEVNPEAVFERFSDNTMTDDAAGELTRPRNARTSLGQTRWQGIAYQLYAGGVAGCISRTATAPLERFKVLVQGRVPGTASLGLLAEIKSVYGEGGIRAFWRGNGANCLKVAPETGTRSVLFEAAKDAFASDPGNATLSERFLCGGAAGFGAQFAVYPLEVLKTRVSLAAPGVYAGLVDCFRKILRSEGVAGLYKGLGPSVCGIVPYAGVDLMVNSAIKEKASEIYRERKQEPGMFMLLGTGCISSTCAMTLTFPLNLIRTRLQASGMPGSPVYVGAADCFRRTVAADGVWGLYRGFFASILKVVPSAAISCAIYGKLKDHK